MVPFIRQIKLKEVKALINIEWNESCFIFVAIRKEWQNYFLLFIFSAEILNTSHCQNTINKIIIEVVKEKTLYSICCVVTVLC